MVSDSNMDLINLTKDGNVTKRILREGAGVSSEKGNSVCVHYESFLQETNTKFDSTRDRKAEFTFNLNSGKVVEAWEIAIPTMKVGEKAEIFCTSDYGYGDEGRTHIVPRKANLRFEVELLGFWENATSAAERIASAEKKKLEGNQLFKTGLTEEALFAYRKARDYIKDLWNCEPEELEASRILIVTIQLNIAACYLKLKNYEFTIEVCKRALDRDCTNIKGYYRLAQAYLELGEFDQCIEFTKLGLEVSFKNQKSISLKQI
ncbi:FK506-binding protein 5 [Helicostylum pulchrum]|uniref:peptidylprolyl isomerase n=1 Tax=Helicostylum pulchrum TaxID=562976 RepID=A0ABP9XR52_9FUNG